MRVATRRSGLERDSSGTGRMSVSGCPMVRAARSPARRCPRSPSGSACGTSSTPAMVTRRRPSRSCAAPAPRPRDIADDELLHADAVVHVAAPIAGPVAEFCTEVSRLLGPVVKPLILGGVVRPMIYTGNAMHNFAYAHRVVQQPGPARAQRVPRSR